MPWKSEVKTWSTPVIENNREKGSNRLIGYLSSRVSWPSLVTVPFTGDGGKRYIIIIILMSYRQEVP
jgi:hypothetical protein